MAAITERMDVMTEQISRESQCLWMASSVWKGHLVCDLEDFDFLHYEIPQTRENNFRPCPRRSRKSDQEKKLALKLFALQPSETQMSQKYPPHKKSQTIASSFLLAVSGNFLAGKLRGFFSVKRKRFRLGSAVK
jgi:hypothetical protein